MNPGLVRFARVAMAGAGLLAAEGPARARCPDPKTLTVGDPCKTYGEDESGSWSTGFPFPFVATLALRSLSYAPRSGTSFDGNVESSPLAYQFPATLLGASNKTFGVEATVAWIPVRYAYVGLSLGGGIGQWTPAAFSANSLGITPRGSLDATVINYAALAGLRLPLGVISVRGEIAVGGSFLSIDQYASNGSNQLTATASANVLLIEPRVAVDWWVTPSFTVSLLGAMPWCSPSATDVGVAFAVHTRVFDGG